MTPLLRQDSCTDLHVLRNVEQTEVKDRTLCLEIASDEELVGKIESLGFLFRNRMRESTWQVVFHFASFLLRKGRYLGLEEEADVSKNIYDKEWIKKYVYKIDELSTKLLTEL